MMSLSLLSRSGGFQMTDKSYLRHYSAFSLFVYPFFFPPPGHGRPLLGEWEIGGGGQREGSKTFQCVCRQNYPPTG